MDLHLFRVDFALWFAYEDLERMRASGGLPKLRDDFEKYLGWNVKQSTEHGTLIVGSPFTHRNICDRYGLREFQTLQKKFLRIMEGRFSAAGDPRFDEKCKKTGVSFGMVSQTYEVQLRYSLSGFASGDTLLLLAGGGTSGESPDTKSTDDEILFLLSLALTNIDCTRIVRCEECKERLFFRAHGRKFCSLRCKNRNAFRRYVITHEKKENDGEYLTRLGKKSRDGVLISGESLMPVMPGKRGVKK